MQIGKGDEKAAGAAERKIDQRGRDAARTGDRPGNMKGGKKPLMRSIHKKTLKRFLSTLLALTMVLGMVPFTASAAAPATVTLEQSGLKATITPSVPAVTAGNTSTVTYAVTIEATAATASGKAVSLTIGPSGDYMFYGFGTVTIDGSPSAITSTQSTAGFTLSGGKITGTVTKNYAIGSHTVPMSLSVSDLGTDSDSATFTVDRKAALTVTTDVPSGGITAGEDFTVTATSDVAEGRVLFEYNGESKYVDVESRLNGSTTIGYAECTFAAVTSADEVKATQFDMTGVVNTEDADTIIVTAATVYHTITFDGNAVDAYHIPDPVSVEHNDSYDGSTPGPDRTGYTFAGWATTSDAATPNVTGATLLTVDTDKTLYAVWTKNTVAVTWPTLPITGVTSITKLDDSALETTAPEGSTVTFKVTVTDGYDGSAMVVTANGVALYGTKGTGNTYI